MIDRVHKTFQAVVHHGSYTKAALELCITQPAVSQHIKTIENLYNVLLIAKEGKKIYLTEEGKILNKYILKVQQVTNSLKKDLLNSGSLTKEYNMGATLTIGEYILPEILGIYKLSVPNHNLILQVENTKIISEQLYSNKIDLAFVEGNFDKKLFNYTIYKKDELILTASKNSSLSKKRFINPADLVDLPLILREKGSGTRKTFEDALLNSGLSLPEYKPYMSIGSLTAIKSMVERDLGYTIISRLAVQNELDMGKLVEIEIRNFKIFREFNFIYNKNSALPFVKSFIDFCLSHLRNS